MVRWTDGAGLKQMKQLGNPVTPSMATVMESTLALQALTTSMARSGSREGLKKLRLWTLVLLKAPLMKWGFLLSFNFHHKTLVYS